MPLRSRTRPAKWVSLYWTTITVLNITYTLVDWKIVTSNPYIFDTYTGRILRITNLRNYWRMSEYCHNFHLHSKGIASIQYNQFFPGDKFPFPMIMKIDGKSRGTGLLKAWSPPDFTFNMSVVYEHVFSLFHFNSYYQLYSCPINCRFRSNLTKIEFLKPDRHGIKFDYKLTVSQLDNLVLPNIIRRIRIEL